MTNIPDAGRTEVSREMEEAMRDGLVDGLVYVGEPVGLPELIVVRPVVEDDGTSWPGELGALVSAHEGSIVAFASADPRLAAEMAAAYASWRGDRGGDVVLIDGSLERPVIDRPLLEDGHEGYVDAVLYGVSARAVTRRTLARGVRVVTAGSRPLTIGRALDPARLSEFAQQVEAGLALLVLPLRHAPLVAESLGALVLVDEDERELLRAARTAREAGASRVICVRPLPPGAEAHEVAAAVEFGTRPAWPAREERAAAHEEAHGSWPTPEDAEDSHEETPAEPAPVFGHEETPPKPAPVFGHEETLPEPAPAEPEPESVLAHEEESLVSGSEATPAMPDEVGPSPFLEEEEPFIIAASGGPVRRRYGGRITAVVLLLVATGVIVWGWLAPAFREGGEPIWRRPAPEGELGAAPAPEQESATGVAAQESEQEAAIPGEETAPDAGGAPRETGAPMEEPGGAPQETSVPVEEAVAASGEQSGHIVERSRPLSGPGGPYVIYLSSQRLYTAAEIDVDEARKAGLSAQIVDADVPGSGMWHRVALVGGFPDLDEARNTLDIIKELGYEGAWIARAPRDE